MKKLFLILLANILLISFVSAWEYDNSYSYGSASAYAKIIGSYPQCDGKVHGDYCAGRWYVDVDFVGDKFYLGEQKTSWPTAGDSGFSGIPSASPGRKYLSFGNGEFPYYIICAWDYNKASNGDWAWTDKCGGYFGSGNLDGKKNVDCYDNSDCGSSQYCDRSGTWDQWSCKTKICDEGQERCFGPSLQKCESNSWQDKGIVIGKCSVECKSDSDCPGDEKGTPFCMGNNIMQEITTSQCTNYQCSENSFDEFVELCDYKCGDVGSGAFCIDEVCDEGALMCQNSTLLKCENNDWGLSEECEFGCEKGKCIERSILPYILWGGGALIFIIIIVFVILFTSKKK